MAASRKKPRTPPVRPTAPVSFPVVDTTKGMPEAQLVELLLARNSLPPLLQRDFDRIQEAQFLWGSRTLVLRTHMTLVFDDADVEGFTISALDNQESCAEVPAKRLASPGLEAHFAQHAWAKNSRFEFDVRIALPAESLARFYTLRATVNGQARTVARLFLTGEAV
jgi:hypothetical protein